MTRTLVLLVLVAVALSGCSLRGEVPPDGQPAAVPGLGSDLPSAEAEASDDGNVQAAPDEASDDGDAQAAPGEAGDDGAGDSTASDAPPASDRPATTDAPRDARPSGPYRSWLEGYGKFDVTFGAGDQVSATLSDPEDSLPIDIAWTGAMELTIDGSAQPVRNDGDRVHIGERVYYRVAADGTVAHNPSCIDALYRRPDADGFRHFTLDSGCRAELLTYTEGWDYPNQYSYGTYDLAEGVIFWDEGGFSIFVRDIVQDILIHGERVFTRGR